MKAKDFDYKLIVSLFDYENQRHNFVLLLPQCETQEEQVKLLNEINKLTIKINAIIKLII